MVLPTVFVNYIGFDLHHNEKSDRIIPIALFVGAEGVEPPTLCL